MDARRRIERSGRRNKKVKVRRHRSRSQNTPEMVFEQARTGFLQNIEKVFLECLHPGEEGPRTGVIVFMPAVREILGGIDRIADVPLAVRKALNQPHRRQRSINRPVFNERRVPLKFPDDSRQGGIHIQFVAVKMRRERRDDDRDRRIVDALMVIEAQIAVALHELDRTLKGRADQLIGNLVDAGEDYGRPALNLLLLLQQEGILTLKEGIDASSNATKLDIAENPLNIEIVEMEAAQLVSSLPDVELAVINGNYALLGGLNASSDALAIENADGDAAQTYANIIAVKEGSEKDPGVLALVKALQSDAVRDYINATYGGAVVPIF